MVRKKIKYTTDQRPFIMVYHDFLDSDLLNIFEKMVFIVLKKYADSNNKCFPSLKKLTNVTKISRRKVQDILKSLENKHVIGIENRAKEDGGYTSNLYTLYDYREVWQAGSIDEVATVVDQMEEKHMIEALTAKGYIITKENGLISVSDQTADISTKQNKLSIDKGNTATAESQGEEYTEQDIKALFDYDALMADYPEHEADLNVVFDILHEVLNTGKQTIRIGGEDKPKEVVKGKLMKLESYDIVYAIDKFHEQVHKIKNTRAYLLTILYHAREQSYLDLMNLGHRNGDF